MRNTCFRALTLCLAVGAALPAQSTHPKFKSRAITVASFAILPPRVSGTGKGVEVRDVTTRSQGLAKDIAKLLDEALTDLNWDVRDLPWSEAGTADAQTAYDRVALRMHDKPGDVNKGAYTLAEGVGRPDSSRAVDALLFSRATAEFEEKVTGSRTATSISISISYLRKVHARFAVVSGRSGEVLHFFEVRASGDDAATEMALKDGIMKALRRVESSVVALPVMAVEPPRDGKPAPDAPKLATWKGERVTILGTRPLGCAQQATSSMRAFRRLGAAPNAERLSLNAYAGRTGTILETKPGTYENEITIQLDGGDTIVATGDMGLGFHAELEAAKKLVGTSWWSRGAQTMAQPDALCEDFGAGKGRIDLRRLQKVTIVDAAFGSHLQKLQLTVETDDGRRGVIDGWSGYDYLDDRFHLVEHRFGVGVKPYADRFFVRDPRKP